MASMTHERPPVRGYSPWRIIPLADDRYEDGLRGSDLGQLFVRRLDQPPHHVGHCPPLSRLQGVEELVGGAIKRFGCPFLNGAPFRCQVQGISPPVSRLPAAHHDSLLLQL